MGSTAFPWRLASRRMGWFVKGAACWQLGKDGDGDVGDGRRDLVATRWAAAGSLQRLARQRWGYRKVNRPVAMVLKLLFGRQHVGAATGERRRCCHGIGLLFSKLDPSLQGPTLGPVRWGCTRSPLCGPSHSPGAVAHQHVKTRIQVPAPEAVWVLAKQHETMFLLSLFLPFWDLTSGQILGILFLWPCQTFHSVTLHNCMFFLVCEELGSCHFGTF